MWLCVACCCRQLVLEDLTAGLALLVERPFSVGDCISVGGGPSASVLSVGVKSTVLRTSGGDVLVVGNKDLASGRITKYPPLADRQGRKEARPPDP